jgi:hypothetical protein
MAGEAAVQVLSALLLQLLQAMAGRVLLLPFLELSLPILVAVEVVGIQPLAWVV